MQSDIGSSQEPSGKSSIHQSRISMSVHTERYGGLTQAIVTECIVFPTKQEQYGEPKFFHAKAAMWDTGATNTVLSPKVIQALGLQPFAQSGVVGVGGDKDCGVYKVNLGLPGGQIVCDVTAYESDLDYDMLIGMDVILLGDFCFTNKDGQSVFSFRLPSTEHIELK